MCLAILREEGIADRPLRDVLRAALPGAARTGALAATFVVAAVAVGAVTAPPTWVATRAVGAFGLGTALQATLVVGGAVVLRARNRDGKGATGDRADAPTTDA